MNILFVIIISFFVTWLDIVLTSWWPVWLLPVWVWIGIHYFILKKNSTLMWFWVFSCAVMGLFTSTFFDGLLFFIIFGLGGQVFIIIYKKYLSISNYLIILLPSLMLLSMCLIVFMLVSGQIIGWALIGRICVTIIASGIITYFYDPQKEKKKYI